MLVALVIGVEGHGHVAQHGFGPRGGHSDESGVGVGRGRFDGVLDVPEVALDLAVFDFVVGQGGLVHRTPVDQVGPLVDQSLVIEAFENGTDGFREALVERETGAGPVARAAELTQLIQNDTAVLVAPPPHAFEEGFASHLTAVESLLAQFLLDAVLGGDAGVVGAGQPERVDARHAFPAGQDVLEGTIEGMTHVEAARDVGRGDDDGEGGFSLAGIGLKIPFSIPVGVPFLFQRTGIVLFAQFHRHGYRTFSCRCGAGLARFRPGVWELSGAGRGDFARKRRKAQGFCRGRLRGVSLQGFYGLPFHRKNEEGGRVRGTIENVRPETAVKRLTEIAHQPRRFGRGSWENEPD